MVRLLDCAESLEDIHLLLTDRHVREELSAFEKQRDVYLLRTQTR
jgi:hypothetical protein